VTTVVAFDLDGTLLPGNSVSTYLAAAMGRGAELADLELRYAAGAISNAEIADRSASWFTGQTPAMVGALLTSAPWICGVPETVATLRAAGVRVLLATVTWQFAADHVARLFGFEAASGTVMDTVGGRLTGRVARYCDEFDKRDFVRAWCAAHGTDLQDVAAVGDARSDLPLFSIVGRAIAINATPDAQAAADDVIVTDDLRDVLPAVLGRPR
jgi:phosphoserine phosphatase